MTPEEMAARITRRQQEDPDSPTPAGERHFLGVAERLNGGDRADVLRYLEDQAELRAVRGNYRRAPEWMRKYFDQIRPEDKR